MTMRRLWRGLVDHDRNESASGAGGPLVPVDEGGSKDGESESDSAGGPIPIRGRHRRNDTRATGEATEDHGGAG